MADERQSYKTLLSYTHAGALAEDAVASSSVVNFGDDEAFQIDTAEIFPPYLGADIENVLIQILVDGNVLDTIHLEGRMGAPFARGYPVLAFKLGDRMSINPFENTCPKGDNKLQVKATGLIGDVTGDFTVRLKGDYFKKDKALTDFFGPTFAPGPYNVVDGLRGKMITINRPTPVSLDTFTNFCAGNPKADKPRVMPYIRFARNYDATVVNTEFRIRHESGNTKYAWENMSWDLKEKEALILEAIGVEPDVAQHIKELWVQLGGVEYPQDRWDCRFEFNELPIGGPADGGIINYQGPRILEKKYLTYGELAEIRAIDDGTSIPAADPFLIALWAKRIELA